MISNHVAIAKAYLRGWFFIDLIASVPLDLLIWICTGAEIGELSGSEVRSAKLVRIVKIFRVVRILRLLKIKRLVIHIEMFFGLNFSVMSILKFFIAIAILSHLIACGFLSIGNQESDGWMDTIKMDSKSTEYIASIYWAMTSMTTIGYGDLFAITVSERVYSIVAQLIGAFAFTYSVTRIVHILYSMNLASRDLTEKLETISEWALYHGLYSMLSLILPLFPDSLSSDSHQISPRN